MGQPEENQVWLLGCNVSTKSRWMQLLICGGGFFFGYMINGVCEVCTTLNYVLFNWRGEGGRVPVDKKLSAICLDSSVHVQQCIG